MLRALIIYITTFLSINALASLQLNKTVLVYSNQKRETQKLCMSCTEAKVIWRQNLDPDDGAIVDEAHVRFYKNGKYLFRAKYQFDEITANRYSNTNVKGLLPFQRKVGNKTEMFIINTIGEDTFNLFRM